MTAEERDRARKGFVDTTILIIIFLIVAFAAAVVIYLISTREGGIIPNFLEFVTNLFSGFGGG